MLLKEANLYINEKNIVTLQPYSTAFEYGIYINGVDYRLGTMTTADAELQRAKFALMKSLCTRIIKAIEK